MHLVPEETRWKFPEDQLQLTVQTQADPASWCIQL